MNIDSRDQIEILKYYKKFLTMTKSSYFSVEVQKWKKFFEINPLEEQPATANSDFHKNKLCNVHEAQLASCYLFFFS